ncbi:hypothetical protein M899_0839 [Bacteriovorax sp. BSW11_IV]|uniref:zinc-ribbon domain-containing protein n=1 Tax=Bacteriovorax sp. BSW11_IV TaxID=1353529 RepID=UPI000389F204|nr:zinc-ribbon domain-containing protein [Bacteriovorax sp. BSW11_IV]EQC42981.1 hypothetical protein M899_0839 [Bacteriovorax sp. BSW11_IV]
MKNNQTRRTFTLEDLQDYAFSRGGECLAKEFINSTTLYLWKCKNGHKWKETALKVLGKKSEKGSWCPKCAEQKSSLSLSLDDLD